MRINKRVSAGILATALVAGLFTAAPVAAFAEGSAPTEPQIDGPLSETVSVPADEPAAEPAEPAEPAELSETGPEEGAPGEDAPERSGEPVASPGPDLESPAGSADPGIEDPTLPNAPIEQESPESIANGIIAKCTVKVWLPSTARSGNYNDPITLGTNAVDCVKDFKLTIRRISDNRVLTSKYVYSSAEDYQNGRIELEIPGYTSFTIPGKYKAEVSGSSLDYGWARANRFDPFNDYPKVTFGNNVMDLRHTAKSSFAAKRTVQGVDMRGTVVRYDNRNNTNIARAKATVKLQKKQGKSWVTKKTVTTNSQGKFSATVRDNTKASWRAYVPATGSTWAAQRDATVAKKSPGKASTKVSRSYNYFSSRHGTFTVAVKFNAGGGYTAAHKGVKVVVQKQVGSKWKSVKTISTNSSGKLTYAAPSDGRYRFVVNGTSSYVSKTSTPHKTGW